MWYIENNKYAKNVTNVEKYFGKWPFVRAGGAQEPASVVCSLLNLLANWYSVIGLRDTEDAGGGGKNSNATAKKKKRWGRSKKGSAPLRGLWLAHFYLSINAWLWSTVFHWRDTRLTERFDYFSAGGLLCYDLYLSIVRCLGASPRGGAALTTATALALAYTYHVHRMMYVLFDYGLHVMLCIIAGALQTVLWAWWALATPQGRRHPGRSSLLTFMVSVNVAMLLEVLDFPPVAAVLDAHALWHFATAPLVFVWYRFVKADVGMLDASGNDNYSGDNDDEDAGGDAVGGLNRLKKRIV